MEELAEEPLAPQPQADEVKSLRAQWNELGRVASPRDRELLARFDAAAERAFEPCRAHFAELAERRAYNLEQRRAIVDVLEDYVAGERWQSSDWTGVERVLRTARSEWRGYYPVDRRAGREVEARFNELTATIHDHLKSEWDVNSARLESIVTQAAAGPCLGRAAAGAHRGAQVAATAMEGGWPRATPCLAASVATIPGRMRSCVRRTGGGTGGSRRAVPQDHG